MSTAESRMAATFADLRAPRREPIHAAALKPLDFNARSANELRPETFAGMVGQDRLKSLLCRVVSTARSEARTLDHMLLVGSAGTGKTTVAQVVAREMGRDVYQLKAPIEQAILESLGRCASDGDVVIVDEIHLWVKPDRRGVHAAASPETCYSLLEDNRLQTATGVLPFPAVTFIGCTTDTGLLPEPFLARFPMQPRLDPYTVEQMVELATRNVSTLSMSIDATAAQVFATACRETPRVLNRYVRNSRSLIGGVQLFGHIDHALAWEVVTVLNSTTEDGLDIDMQNMLRYLLRCKRQDAQGNVRYQAGVNSIATALGKSRDSKAVALYVEPFLIRRGYVAVTHGGRALTPEGVERAQDL